MFKEVGYYVKILFDYFELLDVEEIGSIFEENV